MSQSEQQVLQNEILAGRSFLEHEHAAEVQRLRRLLVLAVVFWPLFGLLDWMVVTFIQPGRLWVYWALRVVGTIPFASLLVRLHKSPPPSPRVLMFWDMFAYTAAAALIGLMCVEYEGITSPYTAGVILVLMGRGSVMALHWKRALIRLGAIVVAHPAALLSSAIWSGQVRAQLTDSRSVVLLLEYLFFVFAAWIIVVFASHISWILRREVFEARSHIGRYRLKRCIARGGMGEVWEAYDTVLKRSAALKLLAAPRCKPEDIARFQREVRATSELSHPNTVRVFDYGVTQDGHWYYTMELLQGQSLRELVDHEGPLSSGRVASIALQTAHALSEAHQRGIIHRDVKPDNIFVTPLSGADHVKLLDFGIARLTASESYATATRGNWTGGTPMFMSPEVIRGDPAQPSSDVYSLGATIYYALTTKPPFVRDSFAQILTAHLHAPVAPLTEHPECAAIPATLERIVMRCLEKQPGDRFSSARELADALAGVDRRAQAAERGSERPRGSAPKPGGTLTFVENE